jgi:toxin-antitoxin system PIN domain toxin
VFVLDANVLLHAVNESSRHHEPARRWLDDALDGQESVAFTWIVVLAFLRLATHPSIFAAPLTPETALDTVRAWLGQPPSILVDPTDRHLELLAGLLSEAGTAANLVSDAHLAAIAVEHGATLVSFDADFARFRGLRRLVPGA